MVETETFEKCSILFKVKEGEDFNHRNTRQVFRGLKSEPDTEIGQKGAFFKGLRWRHPVCSIMPHAYETASTLKFNASLGPDSFIVVMFYFFHLCDAIRDLQYRLLCVSSGQDQMKLIRFFFQWLPSPPLTSAGQNPLPYLFHPE